MRHFDSDSDILTTRIRVSSCKTMVPGDTAGRISGINFCISP